MKRKYFILTILLISLFAITNCGSNEDEEVEVPIFEEETIVVTGAEIEDIIQSLPSPAEMAASIEASGIPFSKSYIASPEDADDFDTNFQKALGLGILSADLGYLNVYKQSNEIVNFLSAIRNISDDLNVGQFFDFQTLKRLSSSNDIDSLMFLSQTSFRDMDAHLRENYRSHLSALIVTGVWIEGLYLTTQIVKDGSKNESLKETIGDQKMALGMINRVLQAYKARGKNYEKLAGDFKKLEGIYENVERKVIPGEKKTIIIDDIPVIKQGDSTIIKISETHLSEIISLTESIRDNLITLDSK